LRSKRNQNRYNLFYKLKFHPYKPAGITLAGVLFIYVQDKKSQFAFPGGPDTAGTVMWLISMLTIRLN